MTSDRLGRVRELDEALARVPIPVQADRRIRGRLAAEAGHKRVPRSVLLAALLLVLGGAIGIGLWPSGQAAPEDLVAVGPDPAATPAAPSEPASQLPPCARVGGDGSTQLDGVCSIRVERHGIDVAVWDHAVVRGTGRGARLVRGWATFTVDEVAHGEPPVLVEVSAGRIEVLGTRFTVFQGDDTGHVDLIDGRVRFVHLDGTATDVEPGRRLHWGDEGIVTEVEPEPAKPAPGDGMHEVLLGIDRVARLRSAGDYDAAIHALRSMRKRARGRRTREILDYELGTIIELRSTDLHEPCAHWRAFDHRHPASRYATQVARRVELLGCPRPPEPAKPNP